MSQENPSSGAADPPRQPPQSPAPGPSPAMAPGDEAPPGTPGGSGRDGAGPCATCQGTGKVNVGIGGG